LFADRGRRSRMGADAFHVCYGLRWEVDGPNEDEVTLLEKRQDTRQVAARKHRLDSWWGITTDQRRYFVLVGKLVGSFGWENEHAARLADSELARLVEETRRKLREAGFEEEPAWHYQFEPDY
jgi:hypothetical protein